MTTVLLLGLLSAAAIGATRAVVGAPEPVADDLSVTDDASVTRADEATDASAGDAAGKKAAKPRGKKSAKTSPNGKNSEKASEPRRAGGAVSPRDALKGSKKAATSDEEEP